MVVLIMENTTEGFRGELTKWLLEAKAGVFVGNISAAVRERLWQKVLASDKTDAALLIYSADTEQGFRIEMCRTPRRSVIDIEGLFFIKTLL